MSITFGAGITLGAGIAITPSVVSTVNLRFDTNYIGNSLGTEFSDTAVFSNIEGSSVCLTTEQMSSAGKYMVTWTLGYDNGEGNGIGVANRSVDLNHYLGYDSNGIGFFQDGSLWSNGSLLATGYPTWGAYDVVDLAVDNAGNSMWIRVNGGDWNNNPSANPVTNTNGVEIFAGQYIAACIQAYASPSEWTICLQPQSTIPAGFTFWGPGPAFAINIGNFANGNPIYQNTNPLGLNGTAGFENTAQETWLGEGYYITNLTHDTITRISTALTAAGIATNNSTGHLFLATWGAGSNYTGGPGLSYGLVKIGFYDGNGIDANAYLDIQAINYFINSDWQTPNNNNGYSLVGTFLFPATFTVYDPLTNKSGWC